MVKQSKHGPNAATRLHPRELRASFFVKIFFLSTWGANNSCQWFCVALYKKKKIIIMKETRDPRSNQRRNQRRITRCLEGVALPFQDHIF